MNSHISHLFSLFVILGLILNAPASTVQKVGTYNLSVEVIGVKGSGGVMNIGLFNSNSSFPDREKAMDGALIKLTGPNPKHTFRNLPTGSYCVAVFHDENNNGTLDKNWFGIPTEGFGFSKDAMGTFGPPSFEEAKVDLKSDQHLKIRLRYY